MILAAAAAAIALPLILVSAPPSAAQDGPRPTVVPGIAFGAALAPASISADIPIIPSDPASSGVQKELIGPYLFLRAGKIDFENRAITLPLYRGQLPTGEAVWYFLTDTSDAENAEALGINYAPKLAFADAGRAVRPGRIEPDGTVTFERGRVDFSPEWSLTPGEAPRAFPPTAFTPGAVGDADYSPLVKIDGHIYNAPVVAFGVEADALNFCDGSPDYALVHDKVRAICPAQGTVTIRLTLGYSFARPVFYLSTEASDPMAATMEGAILTPALDDLSVNRRASAFSAVEPVFAVANGPLGKDNPQRQGFNSALLNEGPPLNILAGIPTLTTTYSPVWDLFVAEWVQAAIDLGYRARVTDQYALWGFVQQGWITGPGGSPYGTTGIIVNCPIVWRFQ
jgi:hypothetical protein